MGNSGACYLSNTIPVNQPQASGSTSRMAARAMARLIARHHGAVGTGGIRGHKYSGMAFCCGGKASANRRHQSLKSFWIRTVSIDLAVNEFNGLVIRPNIVLLGSSLMMHPFWSMDAKDNSLIPDIFHYHDSLAMRTRLEDAGFKNLQVFNFAIFGQMVSDAYLYVDQLSKEPRNLMFSTMALLPETSATRICRHPWRH